MDTTNLPCIFNLHSTISYSTQVRKKKEKQIENKVTKKQTVIEKLKRTRKKERKNVVMAQMAQMAERLLRIVIIQYKFRSKMIIKECEL